MNERRDIIVSNTLTGIGRGEVAGYLCHAYCHTGFCEFTYKEQGYSLEDAVDCVYTSRIYEKLSDPNTGIFFQSPRYVLSYL